MSQGTGEARGVADVPLERLGDEIAELFAHLDAAIYQGLVRLREFERREGWSGGFKSCAHWLSWRTGIAMGAAREKMRVARALEQLPQLSEGLRTARLSYSKVRALTRVATPETEAGLLEFALCATAAQVERVVRAWRTVDRNEEARREIERHESRFLWLLPSDDGMYDLRARLDPEVAMALRRALEAASWELYRDRPASGRSTVSQRRADAIGLIAEAALRGIAIGAEGGAEDEGTGAEPAIAEASVPDETTSHESAALSEAQPAAPDSAAPAQPQPAAPESATRAQAQPAAPESAASAHGQPWARESTAGLERPIARRRRVHHPDHRMVILHVDAAVLHADSDGGDAVLEDGIRVSAETSRRLACDASRVVMLHAADGTVSGVAGRTRVVPPAVRRALDQRDGGCRFPGCESRFCDAHHVRHVADGGESRLDNLVLLCRIHHRAVHEEGFGVQMVAGQPVFTRPNGELLPAVPIPPGIADDPIAPLRQREFAEGIDIGPDTSGAEGTGERLDLDWTMLALWRLRRSDAGGDAMSAA